MFLKKILYFMISLTVMIIVSAVVIWLAFFYPMVDHFSSFYFAFPFVEREYPILALMGYFFGCPPIIGAITYRMFEKGVNLLASILLGLALGLISFLVPLIFMLYVMKNGHSENSVEGAILLFGIWMTLGTINIVAGPIACYFIVYTHPSPTGHGANGLKTF